MYYWHKSTGKTTWKFPTSECVFSNNVYMWVGVNVVWEVAAGPSWGRLIIIIMQIEGRREEVSSVREQLLNEREQLVKEKAKYKLLWRKPCEQSSRDDELLAVKEMEVEEVQKRLAEFECHSRSVDSAVTL